MRRGSTTGCRTPVSLFASMSANDGRLVVEPRREIVQERQPSSATRSAVDGVALFARPFAQWMTAWCSAAE